MGRQRRNGHDRRRPAGSRHSAPGPQTAPNERKRFTGQTWRTTEQAGRRTRPAESESASERACGAARRNPTGDQPEPDRRYADKRSHPAETNRRRPQKARPPGKLRQFACSNSHPTKNSRKRHRSQRFGQTRRRRLASQRQRVGSRDLQVIERMRHFTTHFNEGRETPMHNNSSPQSTSTQ